MLLSCSKIAPEPEPHHQENSHSSDFVILWKNMTFWHFLGSQNLTQMSIFDLKIFNLPLNNYSLFDQARSEVFFPFFKSEIRPFFKILRSF